LLPFFGGPGTETQKTFRCLFQRPLWWCFREAVTSGTHFLSLFWFFVAPPWRPNFSAPWILARGRERFSCEHSSPSFSFRVFSGAPAHLANALGFFPGFPCPEKDSLEKQPPRTGVNSRGGNPRGLRGFSINRDLKSWRGPNLAHRSGPPPHSFTNGGWFFFSQLLSTVMEGTSFSGFFSFNGLWAFCGRGVFFPRVFYLKNNVQS